MNRQQDIATMRKDWAESPRWKGITRPYTPEDVDRLRGTLHIEHSLARRGAGATAGRSALHQHHGHGGREVGERVGEPTPVVDAFDVGQAHRGGVVVGVPAPVAAEADIVNPPAPNS